ncbi:hypothetical protein [Streptomyces collinus]|uniref:Uncharacterized protein n=1 Tax=Streptomyces collinus (strain DSM 40733 / Tue 365) TaxID=1214242 RepID=S5UYU9_STRC3|nr:hypothetical protein [Streptomyces collinus]AGS70921.1 hypothetical protein B446_20545 [Streptomyces collinus Tu 365]UJA09571.1 hypothetical protein HGI10_35230 [Streptomyces collinus]UJA15565.1 hypothetical protein HGI09_28890 [Streptomyces collinus]
MGYDLYAVIGDGEALSAAARELPAARPASIGQGLVLIPMTDTLFDAITGGSLERAPGFRRLPGGFEHTLAAWSADGPVAYVEADYFGGVGEQRAAVWDGGALVLGPLHLDEGQPFAPDGSPVSQALRRLGVVATAGEDEFSAVGLGRHRHSEAWAG